MALDEFELIDRYFRQAAGGGSVVLGIGDDAAIIESSGRIAVAVDTLVEGVHFPAGFPADALGFRVLAVNCSDIAAMGLAPAWFTLALTLPAADEEWIAAFAGGLGRLASEVGAVLVGGDTTRGPLTVTVQVIADAGSDPVLTRAGASAGDAIYLTGTIGDAAGALALGDDAGAWLVQRFRYPQPRIEAGLALREFASAAIDLSDGFVADLGHLCAASGCGAVVDVAALPLSAALVGATGIERARPLALAGGDDYELCVTVPAAHDSRIEGAAAAAGVPLTRVGECTAGNGVDLVLDGAAYQLAERGYRHFR